MRVFSMDYRFIHVKVGIVDNHYQFVYLSRCSGILDRLVDFMISGESLTDCLGNAPHNLSLVVEREWSRMGNFD